MTITFTGTVTNINININLRLAGLSVTLTTNYSGAAASLQIVTSDQGNTGTGGTLTDNDTVSITVGYGLFTNTADIGSGTAGPTCSAYASSVYTQVCNGTDIWGTSDQFHHLYRSWTGDGTIITRVTAPGNTAVNAKAGIMFREGTAACSAHATMHVKPIGDNGVEFLHRDSTGATTSGAQTG